LLNEKSVFRSNFFWVLFLQSSNVHFWSQFKKDGFFWYLNRPIQRKNIFISWIKKFEKTFFYKQALGSHLPSKFYAIHLGAKITVPSSTIHMYSWCFNITVDFATIASQTVLTNIIKCVILWSCFTINLQKGESKKYSR
jgi:hypothetical protein